MSKILIAYYSHTGTTKEVGERIKSATGGDVFEITPVNTYPADIGEVIARGQKEIEDGITIELSGTLPDAEPYDLIIAGTPNWCSTIAPPVASFLKALKLSGKRVALYVTHGRGGLGHIPADIAKLLPDVKLAEVYDGNEPEKLSAWLGGIGAV
ncbi:MAG: hypothetical protein LBK23_03280 [Oscillospiraceae bacterium]|jgi:flavodoxin|nr:hypothetical protein [Oscillospiraceae bacterium]